MRKFLKLKSRANESEAPHFERSVKNQTTGKWEPERYGDSLTGIIRTGHLKEGNYQGSKYTNFVIMLDTTDGDELQVEMQHTSLTYTILNSLTALPLGSEVTIVLKKKKADNGKIYPNANISAKGFEKIDWRVHPKDFPRAIQVFEDDKITPLKSKGKNVYNDTKVVAFWEQMFKEWVEGYVPIKKTDEYFAPPVEDDDKW